VPLPENVAGVLIDIEGTTTPITFVCDVLFPYAADRLARGRRRTMFLRSATAPRSRAG